MAVQLIPRNEPRARDIDLAERNGYERPRKIRDLVKTYLASGDLSQDDVRPVVGRTRIGIAERNVTEFWLSEAAALFIIAKSETAPRSVLAGLCARDVRLCVATTPNACACVLRTIWAHPGGRLGALVVLPLLVVRLQHHHAQAHRLELAALPVRRARVNLAGMRRRCEACSVRGRLSFPNRS